MFGYCFAVALRSLRQNKILTALMIIAVGVGIGASMTTLSIFRTMSADPIPAKSRQLFAPQIDNYGPATDATLNDLSTDDRLPLTLTYTDAVALMRAHEGERQAAMFPTAVEVTSSNPGQLPLRVFSRATYADFFRMFDVPFEYGAPWSTAEDRARAPVVVLSRELNDELFNGADSVGRTVSLNNEEYKITGVIQDWYPIPPFYDLGGRAGTIGWAPEKMFLPFTTAIARDLPKGGDRDCPKSPGPGMDAILHSECDWVKMWVELPNAAAVRSYRRFLTNYAAEQRRIGRFSWAPRVALRDVRQWLVYNDVVSNDLGVLVLVSFAFLLVCVLNGVALMLAKFMMRSPQVSIRRAMGAPMLAIFMQCLVEAGVIGLTGGLLGLGLSALGLLLARGLFNQLVGMFLTQFDGSDILIAVALSVGATLLAGLYPTWCATRMRPSRRRNVVGAALIALQMAVTLAILCNAVFIVEQNLAKILRPSGVDEVDDFSIVSNWIGNPADLNSRIQADVGTLRAIPAVRDAYQTNSQPLTDGGATVGITLHPGRPDSIRTAAIYFGDQNAMDTLGFKLVAGRNFRASEISDYDGRSDLPTASGILVTRALARQLAPGGEVLGNDATLSLFSRSRGISVPIVGIIDTLQVPFADVPEVQSFVENSLVLPYRYFNSSVHYIVRARPGRLAEAVKAAPMALARLSQQRVISVQALSDGRRTIYRSDRTVAIMLTLICLILLAVTAFGIIGLTSYWVSQRRRQIGIRRALGATRGAIMRYFQTENFLITVVGALAGVVLAVAGNLWIVKYFAMQRLPGEYVAIGVVAIFALGQLAVLWPALRAASVPPAVATRTI